MAGRVLQVNIDMPSEETVNAVSSVIEAGGTAIYPSDTVYGIIADCHSRTACAKVTAIKGYKTQRPFIILVPDMGSALAMTTQQDAMQLMQQHWPGPVTLVFKASSTVPEWLVSTNGTVALRLPADQLSTAILKKTGRFLITTSANKKGESFPLTTESINDQIRSSVDLTLNADSLPSRKPSKVIDCTGTELTQARD